MLPIMIFKGQIVVHKLQELYNTAGVIQYVEKAPSERYSILLKAKLISWGMAPLVIVDKLNSQIIHWT